MEYSRVNLKTNLFLLNIIGLWKYKTNNAYYYVYTLIVFCTAIGQLLQSIIYFLHQTKLERMVISLILTLSALLTSFRVFDMVSKWHRIDDILNYIDYLCQHFGEKLCPEEQKSLQMKMKKALKIHAIIYFNLCMCSALMWLTRPIYEILPGETEFDLKGHLPIENYTPWPVEIKKILILTYIFQCVCFVILCMIFGAVQPIHVSFISHVTAQFRTLNIAIAKKPLTSKRLALCIQYHNKIFKLADKVEKFSGLEIFIQCCTFVYSFGFLGFMASLMGITNPAISRLLIYIIILLMQNFMSLKAGDNIVQQSLLTAETAYETDWHKEEYPSVIPRAIQFIILRSQKPCMLKATDFVKVSIVTFASLINTSFGYITLLQNIDKN